MAKARIPDRDPGTTRTYRIPPALHEGARRIAARHDRTIAAQIRCWIREGLAREGVKLPTDTDTDTDTATR